MEKTGLVHLYTGDGKGKTTAAVGLCVRAAGREDAAPAGNAATFTGAIESQEYYGPYWYKDGGSYVEDWEYSNADYDYFSQEYYLLYYL